MVYEPREDSLLLKQAVKRHAHGRVLDVGTGSGIQAKAALSKGLPTLACDIDPEAVAAAKAQGVNAIQSDLFEDITGRFDTIVFNPPYLPDAEPRDPALDGGPTGIELLTRFLAEAKHYLTPGGQILFVQSSITSIEKTKQLLSQLGYRHEIVSSTSIMTEELVVFRAWVQ
ncbi:MAG: methyltransferase [Candidatus Diapherotrites archaeon]|nr:methyltransferase [Candidatus Diapherotrites archaeon]